MSTRAQKVTDQTDDEDPTPIEVEVPKFQGFRVWTAGPGFPQEKIYNPGTPGSGIRPGADGAYHVKSQQEADHLKRVLGKRRWWLDDVPDDEPNEKCTTCGWESRSFRAMSAHLNGAHGRPQD